MEIDEIVAEPGFAENFRQPLVKDLSGQGEKAGEIGDEEVASEEVGERAGHSFFACVNGGGEDCRKRSRPNELEQGIFAIFREIERI